MLFETIEFGMPNGTFSRSHVGAILVFEMRSYIKTQNLPFLAILGDPHACLEVNFFVAETIKIFIALSLSIIRVKGIFRVISGLRRNFYE